MNKLLHLLIVCLLATALAGCHEPETPGDDDGDGGDGGDGTDGGDNMTASLTVQDPPTAVNAGETFQLTVEVDVSMQMSSDHAGFHYSVNESSEGEPKDQWLTILSERSNHTSADVPGSYTVNWTIPEGHEGETVYYRAHIILGGTDYFSDEHSFLVNPLS